MAGCRSAPKSSYSSALKLGLSWHVFVLDISFNTGLENSLCLRKHRFPQASDSLAAWAPLPIRIAVGYGFVAHGYAKLSRGPEKFAVVLHTLGVPDPLFAAWAATLTELIGGAAVMAGVLIPWFSIPMWSFSSRR